MIFCNLSRFWYVTSRKWRGLNPPLRRLSCNYLCSTRFFHRIESVTLDSRALLLLFCTNLPVDTRRYLDVVSTRFWKVMESDRRQNNVVCLLGCTRHRSRTEFSNFWSMNQEYMSYFSPPITFWTSSYYDSGEKDFNSVKLLKKKSNRKNVNPGMCIWIITFSILKKRSNRDPRSRGLL